MSKKVEVTWLEAGKTEVMSMRKFRKLFSLQADEILKGYAPHIVAIVL